MQARIFDAAIIGFNAFAMTVANGFTAAADVDSTAMDLLGADLDEKNPGMVQVVIGADFTGVATSTYTFLLIDCATAGGSYAAITPVGVTTGALTVAALTGVITQLFLPIPHEGVRQFLKLRCSVGTANGATGTLNAGVTK